MKSLLLVPILLLGIKIVQPPEVTPEAVWEMRSRIVRIEAKVDRLERNIKTLNESSESSWAGAIGEDLDTRFITKEQSTMIDIMQEVRELHVKLKKLRRDCGCPGGLNTK